MIRCFVTVAGPYTLLPYFLRHYIRWGVEHFIFSAYAPDYARFGRILNVVADECKLGGAKFQIGFHETEKPMDWRDRGLRVAEIANSHGWLSDWTLYPDLDEFAEFHLPLRKYLDALPEKVKVVSGEWVDRIGPNGELVRIDPRKTLDEQFPLEGRLAKPLADSTTHVIVACRGVVPTRHHPDQEGCASRGYRIASKAVPVHHFRWNGAYRERMQQRLAHYRMIGMPNVPRMVRYMEYFNRHGRIQIEDPALKVQPVRCPLDI